MQSVIKVCLFDLAFFFRTSVEYSTGPVEDAAEVAFNSNLSKVIDSYTSSCVIYILGHLQRKIFENTLA